MKHMSLVPQKEGQELALFANGLSDFVESWSGVVKFLGAEVVLVSTNLGDRFSFLVIKSALIRKRKVRFS